VRGLVDCLECGVKIAYDAVACPHCGTRKTHKAKKEADDKAIQFLIAAPIGIIAFLYMSYCS
jgi:DNA-directed RNA polymerase subunit RPC12/RpoP